MWDGHSHPLQAGAMYGVLFALPLVCLCVASGATLCYLISALLGPALLLASETWRDRLEQWRVRIRQQGGNMISYLIVLRYVAADLNGLGLRSPSGTCSLSADPLPSTPCGLHQDRTSTSALGRERHCTTLGYFHPFVLDLYLFRRHGCISHPRPNRDYLGPDDECRRVSPHLGELDACRVLAS